MKRWWLPNQKGTELWPRQTVMPPKLVIEGVPHGHPLERAIANRFSGRLQQFHFKAQQQYALSPNEIGKLRWNWGDGEAYYINIQGQEYLKLVVHPKLLEQLSKEKSDYWDSAVIDVHIPGDATLSEFCAQMMMPVLQEIEIDTLEPIKGFARDHPWLVLDPIPAYPDGGDSEIDPINTSDRVLEVITGATEQVSSLKVDLRPFRGFSVVVVDIFGYAGEQLVEDPPVFLGWTFTTDTSTDPPTDYGFDHAEPGELVIGSAFNPACLVATDTVETYTAVVAGAPDPPAVSVVDGIEFGFDGSQNIAPDAVDYLMTKYSVAAHNFGVPTAGYTDAVNGNHIFDEIHQSTTDTVHVPPFSRTPGEPWFSEGYDFLDVYEFKVYENVLFFNKRPVYNFPTHFDFVDMPCSLRAQIFKGVPAMAWSEHFGEHVWYRQWEDPLTYPERWGTFHIGDSIVRSLPLPADQQKPFFHFGMPRLGRVTIDLVYGGISFERDQSTT